MEPHEPWGYGDPEPDDQVEPLFPCRIGGQCGNGQPRNCDPAQPRVPARRSFKDIAVEPRRQEQEHPEHDVHDISDCFLLPYSLHHGDFLLRYLPFLATWMNPNGRPLSQPFGISAYEEHHAFVSCSSQHRSSLSNHALISSLHAVDRLASLTEHA